MSAYWQKQQHLDLNNLNKVAQQQLQPKVISVSVLILKTKWQWQWILIVTIISNKTRVLKETCHKEVINFVLEPIFYLAAFSHKKSWRWLTLLQSSEEHSDERHQDHSTLDWVNSDRDLENRRVKWFVIDYDYLMSEILNHVW